MIARCTNYSNALKAYNQGIKCIEIVNDGGMTPSLGIVKLLKENTDLKIIVGIQPKESGYVYNDNFFEEMKLDTLLHSRQEINGISFGCYDKFNNININQIIILDNIIKKNNKISIFKFINNDFDNLEKVILSLIKINVNYIEIHILTYSSEQQICYIEKLYHKYKKYIGFIFEVDSINEKSMVDSFHNKIVKINYLD